MQFLKNFFNHENTVVGLSGLRKRVEYVQITLPENYKKTYIPNLQNNYILSF